MPYRWICLRLLFLLVLLFGGLGALRAEASEPDSLRGEHIGAFDREKLERSFGLVRFRSSAQARYALDLGDESWYLGSVKMDDFYREFATEYTAPWKLIPLGERDVVEAYHDGSKDIDLSRVRFASAPDSPALSADYDESRRAWTLTLPATESNSSYEVFALYEGKVIGKLCVVSYPKQSYKLRLVPVNGQSLGDVSRLSQQLNSIYNKHGVSFTLSEAEGVSAEVRELEVYLKRIPQLATHVSKLLENNKRNAFSVIKGSMTKVTGLAIGRALAYDLWGSLVK